MSIWPSKGGLLEPNLAGDACSASARGHGLAEFRVADP